MSRNRKAQGKKIYSIIVDGETEVWYFQLMKQYESLKTIDIKPELPRRKKLSELYKLVVGNAKDYSKVIWLIDFDTIVKEEKEARKGSKSKILQLDEYITKLKRLKNVEDLINTPCLEFWYLLHLEETGRYYASCNDVCREFMGTILSDYEKTERFYKKKNNDIYIKLKALQSGAIANAKKLGDFDVNNPHTAKAGIFKVFESIKK